MLLKICESKKVSLYFYVEYVNSKKISIKFLVSKKNLRSPLFFARSLKTTQFLLLDKLQIKCLYIKITQHIKNSILSPFLTFIQFQLSAKITNRIIIQR